MKDKIFTVKYAPTSIGDVVLPERLKSTLVKGAYTNILMYGNPGIGKSLTAKLLAKDFISRYVNVSKDGRIDNLREDINDFCSQIQFGEDQSGVKALILDEIDGASSQFYDALRGFMDQYPNVRFIATCNYIHKVPAPIQSRFELMNFDFESQEENDEMFKLYLKRVVGIMKKEGMTVNKELLPNIVKMCRACFPDWRKVLQFLQNLVVSGTLEVPPDVDVVAYGMEEIRDICLSKPDPVGNYEKLMKYATQSDKVLLYLGESLPRFIMDNKPELNQKVPQIVMAVADHQYKQNFMVDVSLAMLACVFHIQSIINN